MKHFIVAQAALAATFLFVASAFGADAASPELSNEVGKHLWLTLIAGALPPITKAFNEGTLNLPTVPARLRILFIAVLSGIGTAAEMLSNGGAWPNAIMAFAIAAGPSLLIEAVHAKWGGWKGATVAEGPKSSDGGPGPKIISVPPPRNSMSPPAPPPTTLRMTIYYPVVIVLAMVAGCAALRTACAGIDLADKACDFIVIKLPDGTTETVRREDIAGVAMQARAARLSSAAKAGADAGTDQ
jgi:hypothetical protein